nr:MAG TPA: hypothetical protein [Caudoviricetes sp.]
MIPPINNIISFMITFVKNFIKIIKKVLTNEIYMI